MNRNTVFFCTKFFDLGIIFGGKINHPSDNKWNTQRHKKKQPKQRRFKASRGTAALPRASPGTGEGCEGRGGKGRGKTRAAHPRAEALEAPESRLRKRTTRPRCFGIVEGSPSARFLSQPVGTEEETAVAGQEHDSLLHTCRLNRRLLETSIRS